MVSLYEGVTFDDFVPKGFAYTPPPGGPWAKVILEADFDVTAGRQFDRSCTLWVGGTCLYYGTTQEPSKDVPQRWHVERDLTDYATLLAVSNPGRVELGTVVNKTYTGVLHGSARLMFYASPPGQTPPRGPDRILPLSAGPTGGTLQLATNESRLVRTFSLPRNIERACLDVYIKSENKDEFWFTDLPDKRAVRFDVNQAPGFREVEVFVDGTPAGVAPVYPLIFTGGADPRLWRPIPGVQTLNFEPYRVELSPFAAVLNDGKPHEVSVGVCHARHHFSATATLLLWLDHNSSQVTGALTENTLGPVPEPLVSRKWDRNPDYPNGTVSVTVARSFSVAGYVDTSHGRVQTRVEQTIVFANRQELRMSTSHSLQDIHLESRVSVTNTVSEGKVTQVETRQTEFPLHFRVCTAAQPDRSTSEVSEVTQRFILRENRIVDGRRTDSFRTLNTVENLAETHFNRAGKRLDKFRSSGFQKYVETGAGGDYRCRITALNGVVTSLRTKDARTQ
jgi:hypothetical protein